MCQCFVSMTNSESPPRPAPVATNERADILDVIRGFALGGVFLSNVYIWLSGMIFVPRAQVEASLSGTIATVMNGVYGVFIAGKFMTMFTFLFGLGLSVQFARAAERDDSAVRRYLRRCFALVFLGVLHLSLLWYGDIAHVYAIIGLFVLLFRNRSTKTLIVWGLLLTLVSVPVGMWIQFALPKYLQSAEALQAATAARLSHEEEFNRQAMSVFQGQSYWAMVRMNWATYWEHFFGPIFLAYNFATLGNFLLGLAAGRLRWFQDVAAHKTAFKRLLGWSALTGILALLVAAAIRHFSASKTPMQDGLFLSILMPILSNVRTLSFALVYMSAITLLYQRDFFKRFFSIYIPAGRMAISNYFAQSAIGVFVFYGIGLGHLGDLRPRWIFAMPLAMFVVQMVLSWLWLRYFRFGPVEWISRSITYGKLQSMRNR